MFYTSKRKIKGFFKTGNMKYYGAFIALLLVVISTFIIIRKNAGVSNDPVAESEAITTTQEQTTTAVVAKGTYRICVNKTYNQVSVYRYNDSEYEKEPCRTMICAFNSDLSDTRLSPEYSDTSKQLWQDVDNGGFVRFYTRFADGISFHSARYRTNNDKNTLIVDDYNTIGNQNSTEGITLLVSDAKWIFENCSFNSEVYIYSDTNEKNYVENYELIDIPKEITWEPSDDSEGSYWCPTEIDRIEAPDKIKVKYDSYEGTVINQINAFDKNSSNVTEYVFLSGKYNFEKAGEYNIVFNLVDIFGNHLTKDAVLIVEKDEKETTTADKTTGQSVTSATRETEIKQTNEQQNATSTVSGNTTSAMDDKTTTEMQDSTFPAVTDPVKPSQSRETATAHSSTEDDSTAVTTTPITETDIQE